MILISRNSWAGFAEWVYSKSKMLMVVEVILIGIVLYYLLQELSIVQIMACIVLGALLTGMVFSAYGKELMPSMLKLLKIDALKKAWIPILVWFVLIIWTLGVLFNFI